MISDEPGGAPLSELARTLEALIFLSQEPVPVARLVEATGADEGFNHRLLIPDLPGSGHSSLTAPLSVESLAAALKELLDREGIERSIASDQPVVARGDHRA